MKVRQINHEQTLDIRHCVLRPNFSRKECIYDGDFDSKTAHFGALMDGQIVGIVSIYSQNSPSLSGDKDDEASRLGFQIRAMATLGAVRGLGYGNLLLQEAEKYALQSGATYIWANARISALGFYQKAGYDLASDEFDISGIGPHKIVVKNDFTLVF